MSKYKTNIIIFSLIAWIKTKEKTFSFPLFLLVIPNNNKQTLSFFLSMIPNNIKDKQNFFSLLFSFSSFFFRSLLFHFLLTKHRLTVLCLSHWFQEYFYLKTRIYIYFNLFISIVIIQFNLLKCQGDLLWTMGYNLFPWALLCLNLLRLLMILVLCYLSKLLLSPLF